MFKVTATELPRIMQCGGSHHMPAALPPDHNVEARDEGNAAHWLAENWIKGGNATVGDTTDRGYIITKDMVEHVSTYVTELDIGDVEVETNHSGGVSDAPFIVHGRADHIKFRDGILTVDDFKYGWRIVQPKRNWTLISHAIGWCIRNGVAPERIVLRIHQPRPYHSEGPMREWSLSYGELLQYNDRIVAQLSAPGDSLHTHVDICPDCPAFHTCPAARAQRMNAVEAISNRIFSDDLPNDVLISQIEVLQAAKDVVKDGVQAIEELLTHRIKHGDVINGYGLETSYSNRRWKKGLTGDALSIASGTDLRKADLVTPAEAERRGVSKEVVASLTERVPTGSKLKRIDPDKIAAKHFNQEK